MMDAWTNRKMHMKIDGWMKLLDVVINLRRSRCMYSLTHTLSLSRSLALSLSLWCLFQMTGVAELMKRGGYATHYSGKWDVGKLIKRLKKLVAFVFWNVIIPSFDVCFYALKLFGLCTYACGCMYVCICH